jgi:DNA-binding PadR family transcriptional regulator
MLEMAVLGLLKAQDMHGYELKKRLSDVFGFSSAVSFGSLYPALGRLEAAGAVQVVAASGGTAAVPTRARRPAGPPGAAPPEVPSTADRKGSRRRKVYGITPLGADMFSELLAKSQAGGDDDRSFSLRLAFARYLPPEERLGLLEQRRRVLGERLAQLSARARARRDDRYMRILCERQREALTRDVSWLDALIQEERGGPAPAGATRSTARLVPLASASQLNRAARGRREEGPGGGAG